MNKKNLYEQQEDIIRKQSEAFITLLTHRGILGEQSIDDEKLRTLVPTAVIAMLRIIPIRRNIIMTKRLFRLLAPNTVIPFTLAPTAAKSISAI